MRDRSGAAVEVEALAVNLLADPAISGLVLTMRDISERKAFERELERHAFYDTVTGLANRALFNDRVRHILAQYRRSHRRSWRSCSWIWTTSRLVNDTFGHAAGDTLLREVGDRLRASLRPDDTAARLGGDEFAVLIEDLTDDADAVATAERILRSLEAPFLVEGRELLVRGSVGIAVTGAVADSQTDDVLRDADVAMYAAKQQGKNRYELYRPALHENRLERLELRADLRRALKAGEFELWYQPLIELSTGAVSGLEALIRWQHPNRGLIAPLDFIPIAEETAMIVPIGNWVLRTACQEISRLRRCFPDLPTLSISVNLSARQLQWHGIVREVEAALHASRIPPSSLVLEVTEGAMMQNLELSVARLEELKGLGVRIAVDDFGSGYSSLNYVRRFPLDILKVDKAFIDRIDEGGEELALADSIIQMARALRLEAVAEGVERREQLDRLVELRCETGQGYYFAPPGRSEAIEREIAARRTERAA